MVDAGVPLVLVDAGDPSGAVSSVAVDDVEGGALAVSHLLARGRRRIAFVGGPLSIPQVADRLEGARRALDAAPDATLEVLELDGLTVQHGQNAGAAIAARPAAERPDAVFCANDLLAVGVLQGASILGDVRVPEDIALIGYDDIDFARATVVPLSSVRQPARQIGATAVELLFETLADPDAPARHVRFRPELVVRASTGGAGVVAWAAAVAPVGAWAEVAAAALAGAWTVMRVLVPLQPTWEALRAISAALPVAAATAVVRRPGHQGRPAPRSDSSGALACVVLRRGSGTFPRAVRAWVVRLPRAVPDTDREHADRAVPHDVCRAFTVHPSLCAPAQNGGGSPVGTNITRGGGGSS